MTYACAIDFLGNIETYTIFRSRLAYAKIESSTAQFPDAIDRLGKKRSFRGVLGSAMCIDNLEYLAN